jgi:hypothetical protein
LPFSPEELAITALVRILPRSRYRLAAQSDARFQSFTSNTTRIAYRQQGATPSFLLFSGPGQNPQAAATAAAAWAEANWRPNAIQRRVSPGVVVVHVAPGNQLTPAGPVTAAAVPATVWTVDSATGAVETLGKPPGSPSAGDIRNAARSLMQGVPAPSLGELDLAEKGVMQPRTTGVPRALTGIVGILLFIFALRYGLGGLASLMVLPAMLGSGAVRGGTELLVAALAINVVLLAGIVLGAGLLLNFRNMAFRVPGFSSSVASTRNLTWGAYIAVMIGLAVAVDGVIPTLQQRSTVNAGQGDYTRVVATVEDDGSETFVAVGGELTVDLSGWPSNEWADVQFKTSNPSVLSLDSTPSASGKPIATFGAHQTGAARVDATSKDGRYTYQLRVSVFAPS